MCCPLWSNRKQASSLFNRNTTCSHHDIANNNYPLGIKQQSNYKKLMKYVISNLSNFLESRVELGNFLKALQLSWKWYRFIVAMNKEIVLWEIEGLGLWCLMPLWTIFQLYRRVRNRCFWYQCLFNVELKANFIDVDLVWVIYGIMFGLGLWCLTPLSTIFQLYPGGQFYW